MIAQKLRHRVTIQGRTNVQQADGSIVATWGNLLLNEPAQVVPQSAREFYESEAPQAETRGRMMIRKPGIAIDTTMRVQWQGESYNIEGVLPDPSDRRWLTLIYAHGVNEGG